MLYIFERRCPCPQFNWIILSLSTCFFPGCVRICKQPYANMQFNCQNSWWILRRFNLYPSVHFFVNMYKSTVNSLALQLSHKNYNCQFSSARHHMRLQCCGFSEIFPPKNKCFYKALFTLVIFPLRLAKAQERLGKHHRAYIRFSPRSPLL